MSKQTSIEWLVDQVEDFIGLIPVDMIEKAKQMHKEEIVSAYRIGNTDDGCNPQQYYQEKYGGSPKTSDN